MTERSKRGRPTADGPAEGARESLTIRVSADERTRWLAAAAREGVRQGRPVTLGAWIRDVCEAAATRGRS